MPLDFLTNLERERYHSVPVSIPETDSRQHFHLTETDHRFLLLFRGAVNRLAIALQVGLIRYMGFLPDTWWVHLPAEVTAFVAHQIGVIPELLIYYGHRQATRSEHFSAVLGHVSYRKWEPMDAVWLEPWLLERALEHDGERVLLTMTCLKLRQERIVRPAISTLERLVGGMNELAHRETYRRLMPLLLPEVCQQLDALLLPDNSLKISPLRWLSQPAALNNPAEIIGTLAKLTYLQTLNISSWPIDSLHPNRQKRFAKLARIRSTYHLERLPAYKRYPILVAFLRESLLTLTDDVLSMYDAFWEHSFAKARREYEQYQQRVASAKDTALQTLGQAVGIVLDEAQTPSEQVRAEVFARIPRQDLILAWEAVQTLLYPTRYSHLTFLTKRYTLFKQFTPHLLAQIQFEQGFTDDDFTQALTLVTNFQLGHRRKWPTTVPTGFMKPSWRKFVQGKDGQAERQPYELCVLSTLRDRLRSGDTFVTASHRYADLNSYLLTPQQWNNQRAELCRQLNLPTVAVDRVGERIAELEALLKPMQDLLLAGGDVRLEEGELVVARLTAEEVPPGAKALQEELSRRLPIVDLTDLIVEVDAWVGFTQYLPGLEHTHRGERHQTLLLACLLATGCNIPLADMAAHRGWLTNRFGGRQPTIYRKTRLKQLTMSSLMNCIANG